GVRRLIAKRVDQRLTAVLVIDEDVALVPFDQSQDVQFPSHGFPLLRSLRAGGSASSFLLSTVGKSLLTKSRQKNGKREKPKGNPPVAFRRLTFATVRSFRLNRANCVSRSPPGRRTARHTRNRWPSPSSGLGRGDRPGALAAWLAGPR